MATGKALNGKPDAGNPHVAPSQRYGGTSRFDEGEVAPAATPRRGSLLYKGMSFAAVVAVASLSAVAQQTTARPHVWQTNYAMQFALRAVAQPPPNPIPAYHAENRDNEQGGKATGFFHVETSDDGARCRLVDPLGRGFIVRGVEHFEYKGFKTKKGTYPHEEACRKRHGSPEKWAEFAAKRLLGWGFNYLGSGSSHETHYRGLPHTYLVGMGSKTGWDRKWDEMTIRSEKCRWSFPDVFHPDFPSWCEKVASVSCAPHRDDPWLVGYFIDNELPWWGTKGLGPACGLYDAALSCRSNHTARIAAERLASEHPEWSAERLAEAFQREVAERYFSITTDAIRRHDPNHLILGCRFLDCKNVADCVLQVAGKYCDVVTANVYAWADLKRGYVRMGRSLENVSVEEELCRVHRLCKRPMLITEWSFLGLDSGLPCTTGAGQRFETQAERAQAAELYVRTQLGIPFLLGYNFFMYLDQPSNAGSASGEDCNYGLVTIEDEPYTELVEMFSRLNREISSTGRPKEPPRRHPPTDPGQTVDTFLGSRPVGGGANPPRCERIGDAYRISNDAGLELNGKIGGRMIFDEIKAGGVNVGSFSGMLSWYENGRINGGQVFGRRWTELEKVADASWRLLPDGRGVLTVKGCVEAGGTSVEIAYAFTVAPDTAEWTTEIVSAKNVGAKPIDVRFLYLRPWTNCPDDPANKRKPRFLCRRHDWDAWYFSDKGLVWGAYSKAPLLCEMNLAQGHPDLSFEPGEGPFPLAAGDVYEPKGKMWAHFRIGRIGAARIALRTDGGLVRDL